MSRDVDVLFMFIAGGDLSLVLGGEVGEVGESWWGSEGGGSVRGGVGWGEELGWMMGMGWGLGWGRSMSGGGWGWWWVMREGRGWK